MVHSNKTNVDQDLEVIFQPNDVLTNSLEMIVGGAGQPGQPGNPGVPGDCPDKCIVRFECICKGLWI